jgi:hypothetical protein
MDYLIENLRGMCASKRLDWSTTEPCGTCAPCLAARRLEIAYEALADIRNECSCWQADACSERVMRLAEQAIAKVGGR